MRTAGLLLLLLALALGIGVLIWIGGEEPGAAGLAPGFAAGGTGAGNELPAEGAGADLRAAPDSSFSRDAAARGVASRLAGRCTTYLGNERVAGVRLEFRRGETRLASATSDEEGAFEAELSEDSFDGVEITPPAGLWVVEHGLERDGYEVLLASLDIGPLRARLVDEATGESVPHYVVEVRDEVGWSETVISDAEGILVTELLLARGMVFLSRTAAETNPDLAGDRIATHEHLPAGSRPPLAIIPLEVGPTYFLLLEKPEPLPLARLRAYLEMEDEEDRTFTYVADPAPVRDGELPWVRFAGDCSWVEEGRLVVTDANGRWRGTARVDSSPGVHADPVPLRLERMGRLSGRFLNAEGEGVSRVDVQLTALDPGDASPPRRTKTGALGNFIFEGVVPGPYSLEGVHVQVGSFQGTIEVARGDGELRDFQLEPFSVAGDIAGVVRSRTGSFSDTAAVVLWRTGRVAEELPPRSIRLVWSLEGGEQVGRFHFVSVAEGEYSLDVILYGAPYRVEPEGVTMLQPPVSDLEFLIEDDREVFRLYVRVVDAVDGHRISEALLRFSDARGEWVKAGRAQWWTSSRRYSEGDLFSWEVSAPGYRTLRGDLTAFEGPTGWAMRSALIRLQRE